MHDDKKNVIYLKLSKEDFLELIQDKKNFLTRVKKLEADPINDTLVEWLYINGLQIDALDVVLKANSLFDTICEGDEFYYDMHDEAITAEQIANKYYPFFDFVDNTTNYETSAEYIKTLRELMSD